MASTITEGWIEAVGIVSRQPVQYSLGIRLEKPYVTIRTQPGLMSVLANGTNGDLIVNDKKLISSCKKCGLTFTSVASNKIKLSDGITHGDMTVTPGAITIITNVEHAVDVQKRRPSFTAFMSFAQSCLGSPSSPSTVC